MSSILSNQERRKWSDIDQLINTIYDEYPTVRDQMIAVRRKTESVDDDNKTLSILYYEESNG